MVERSRPPVTSGRRTPTRPAPAPFFRQRFTAMQLGTQADWSTATHFCPTCVTLTHWTSRWPRPHRETRLSHLRLGPRTAPNGSATPPSHPVSRTSHTMLPVCHVFDRFGDHAAVCGCAADRNRRHNAAAHVFYAGGLHPPKQKGGLLQPRPDTGRLPQRASLDRPADVSRYRKPGTAL